MQWVPIYKCLVFCLVSLFLEVVAAIVGQYRGHYGILLILVLSDCGGGELGRGENRRLLEGVGARVPGTVLYAGAWSVGHLLCQVGVGRYGRHRLRWICPEPARNSIISLAASRLIFHFSRRLSTRLLHARTDVPIAILIASVRHRADTGVGILTHHELPL